MTTPRWFFEENNKWIEYDEETSKQIEDVISNAIRQKIKGNIIVKLKYGPRFGTVDNKEQYIVNIILNASSYPAVIRRSVQTSKKNSIGMVNVARFPCLDIDDTEHDIKEIMDYKCKYKWFYKSECFGESQPLLTSDDDEDNYNEYNGWKEYDVMSSKQIEIALNKQKKFVILNKSNYFKSPKNKNLFRVEFNHHSIPSEATQIQFVELNNKEKTDILYKEIEELKDKTDQNMDEVMSMIMMTKHYMFPISMKYWTQKRIKLNDKLECRVCLEPFEERNFLEYWVSHKLQNKGMEEIEIISSKQIAIKLCECKGEHFFHTECIAKAFIMKRKCPLCQLKYGVTIGHQPNGTMKVRIDKKKDVDGDENKGKGLIEIIHDFPNGIQGRFHQNPGQRYWSDQRYIYLPYNRDGREILELIKIGWKRKVLYNVGYSVTRRVNNCIIWNGIHFKTSTHGGTTNYGWPDSGYFDRVKDEFKQKGITIHDIGKN